jgi:GxxExxY protein
MDNRDPDTFAILGAAFEVRRVLGGGFLEAVYRTALQVEFVLREIPYAAEPDLNVHYKDRPVGRFRPDFICYGRVLVEVKAAATLDGGDVAQTLNYLRVSGVSRGLLINFGPRTVEFRRYASPSLLPGGSAADPRSV